MRLRSGVLAVALAGCAGRPTLRDHEHQLAITVHNETETPLCEVHIYLAHHADTGHNWLQAQPEIAGGAERGFWVPKKDPAETYQVQVVGCPTGKLGVSGYAPSVFMNGPAHVVLFDDGNPARKQAAAALAHANENTTLIPAKFSRRSQR